MNKTAYLERSRKLRTPQRCPLIGYCDRWVWTVFFLSYLEANPEAEPWDVLRDAGDLPIDFESKRVSMAVENPRVSHGDGTHRGEHLCPEVSLFSPEYTPSHIPVEAISSFFFVKGIQEDTKTEHSHFSQCLEYIQNYDHGKSRLRDNLPVGVRFNVLKRDEFTCFYCGRTPEDGISLHVDHKISIKDGGTNDMDNLATSCSECNFGKGAKSVT